jgi:hypothetical protein
MEELTAGRKKRVAACTCLLSVSLMVVVTTARQHLWVTFASIGVEVVVLAFLLREVARMKRGE